MLIELHEVSKRYNQWVIHQCSEVLSSPSKIAIVGANGSGKSTLLKMISGYLSPTSGSVLFRNAQKEIISPQFSYRYLAFCAPYVEFIEELSLNDHFDFHFEHKTLLPGLAKEQFFRKIELEDYRDQLLADLSSGLKQRFILGLTILSDCEIYLLDEPCSFLDENAQQWFFDLVDEFVSDKLCIIATNQTSVIDFCEKSIDVRNYKSVSRA